MENENENNNEEQKNNEENKTEIKFEDFVSKYKETDEFKNFVSEVVKKEYTGLVKNKEELQKEVQDLRKFKSKSSEDEVVKLLTSGSEEDRNKAIELLNSDTISKYQKLIEERDLELNTFKEKESAYILEKERAEITKEFKKSTLFNDVREEAIDDYILPAIYANFNMNDGKVQYIGKEINKAGKPLNLEEFLVSYLKDRKFFLKEKVGSNLFSKTTDTNAITTSKSSYEDRLRNNGKVKE